MSETPPPISTADSRQEEISPAADVDSHIVAAPDSISAETTAEHVTGSTRSAGSSLPQDVARKFPCDKCGADFEFNIGVQKLKCPYCGYEKDLHHSDMAVAEQPFHETLDRLKELKTESQTPARDEKVVDCDTCGASVVFVGSLTSSQCPYCASPIQLDNVYDAPDRVQADGMLPFLIDRESARKNLQKWIQSRWFAPNAFKQEGGKGNFQGVYLPFFTFDTLTFNSYKGSRGENYTVTVGTGKNRRTETRTRWYSASGRFQRFFDDILVLASKGLNKNLMLALEPWPLHKCQPFNQELLAGYLARTYEVELDEAFQDARQRVDEAIDNDVRRRIGGDEQRVDHIQTHCDAITFKHLLLPTWLLSYRFRGKVYQVMVNATTGEVQGERPYSWVKILGAVLAVALVIGGIVMMANS